jgi:prepilin-type N-terminal cleavage/methylation domain-containing protein
MIGGKFKKNKGFTLIEMAVAVAVFSFITASASGLFISGLKAQRASLASQELWDQISYLTEYMSRAIRMAKKDISGACTGTAKLNYAYSGGCLKFVNYKNQCQQFCLDGTRIKNEKGEYLTSDRLQVNNFSVTLTGQTQNDDIQPKVSIILDVGGREGSKIKIQTSVSQRNLDVQK